MSSKRDYYEVLSVERNADGDTIKRAYRKMAIENHPDKNPGDATAEQRFKEAAEAYSVLSDDGKRQRYDQYGHAGVEGPGGGGGGGGGELVTMQNGGVGTLTTYGMAERIAAMESSRGSQSTPVNITVNTVTADANLPNLIVESLQRYNLISGPVGVQIAA